MSYIPLNLQYFADGGEGSSAQQTAAETPVTPATPAEHSPVSPTADDIAASLMDALEKRTQRAENGVIKSFAQQYGMTEDEMSGILSKARDEKKNAIPEEVQQRIDEQSAALDRRMIAAEVKSLGGAMGLLDADVAVSLLDMGKVSVDRSTNAVDGVQAQLDALKSSKPYLFGSVQQGAWGQKQGGNAPLTKENIMSIKDTAKRQKAIAENLSLFGK